MDSMQRPILLLGVLPLVVSCAFGSHNRSDSMCDQIARFAESAQIGVAHSVTLRGGWGGDTPNILMTHDCEHSGYDPGKQLCDYLVPNTSWEFGQYNARSAVACLDSPERRSVIRKLNQDEWPIEITSSMRILKDKRIIVTVRFSTSNLSVLTLTATRNPHD